MMGSENFDKKTIEGFGEEWNSFNQNNLKNIELKNIFKNYFSIFPWHLLNKSSIGADIGCGSGRWAYFVSPKISKLYCIDPSIKALEVAKKNLSIYNNCKFLNEHTGNISIADNTLDFAYSLGVLHHIPNTLIAMSACTKKLKKDAPFLVYLYYNFENRGFFFKLIWSISNYIRKIISFLPFTLKKLITDFIAIIIYFPLARFSSILSKLNINPISIPLSYYKDKTFYTMRTDSLDRFGTKVENRFSKKEIFKIMTDSNLNNIKFLEQPPYWIALGYKK